MLPSRRVVVTGVGLVTPLGVGVEQSWRRLLAGETAVRRLPSLDGLPAQIAAPVPREGEGGFSLAGCGLAAPGDETSLSTFVQFALAAADEALVQARWSPETRAEQERTGVAIGSGIGGLSDIVEASDALRERGARRVSPFFIPRMLVNMAAGQVSPPGCISAVSPTTSRPHLGCISATSRLHLAGQVSIRAGLRGPSAAPAIRVPATVRHMSVPCPWRPELPHRRPRARRERMRSRTGWA